MTKRTPLSSARIDAARGLIDPVFLDSPLLETERPGFALFAKDDTNNPIRSFKGRGTAFLLSDMVDDDAPLVTASAGNFGQGLAYNAARSGRSLTVFASVNANPLKIAAMHRFGAEVILSGADFDAAKDAAKTHAAEQDLTFVEDGARAAIAEGAGTIAAELTASVADIDAVFVSLGNGALAAGVGCWLKARSPRTRVVAVAATGAPCMAFSHREGRMVVTETANTIADGIAIRTPVPAAVAWLKDTIDDVVLVEDGEILEAMRFARETWGRLIEPAGAAGLAAILARSAALQGQRVATILCGGNLTDEQLDKWFGIASV